VFVPLVDQHCPSDSDHENAKVFSIIVGTVLGLLLLILLLQRNNISKSHENSFKVLLIVVSMLGLHF